VIIPANWCGSLAPNADGQGGTASKH